MEIVGRSVTVFSKFWVCSSILAFLISRLFVCLVPGIIVKQGV